MDIRQNIWIHDTDKFHVHSDGGIVDLTIRSNGRVTLNMSMERAERLYEVLGGFLESRGVPKTPWHAGTSPGRRDAEPDGAAGRRDITPAEAVVDADELLASMAASYDVRRSEWEPDPAVGRQNCPGDVP